MNYIISDIHGCFYTLEKLLEKVRVKDEDPHFIFIGDYVDRGKNSKECVELMIQLQSEGAVCIRGNHDDVVNYILNGESFADLQEMMTNRLDLMSVGAWWLHNGLYQTVVSYTDVKDHDLLEMMKQFVESVPASHKAFFRDLKTYWENDTHFALHAYFDPTESLPKSLMFLPTSARHDILWTRFLGTKNGVTCPKPVWDKIGVFGHTPLEHYGSIAPIKYGNLRLIDTGAFMNLYLTAYCAEQDDHVLQATDSRDI